VTEKLHILRKGEEILKISTLITLILAVLKGTVGYFSGSVALITDALHSGADLTTRFVSWFGLKIAQRKPDEKFPYGYYKAESLAALLMSTVILYAGYGTLMESVTRLFTVSEMESPILALIVSLISAFTAYLLASRMEKVGKEIHSQSLMVSAEETRLDIYASLLVFAAILSTYFKIPYFEGSVGIFLSILIFKIGIENGKISLYNLMDVSPAKNVENKVKKILSSCNEIEGFEGLKLRQAGPFIFGEVKIKVKKFIPVSRSHEIAEKIEKRVKNEVEQIESLSIHVEPYTPKMLKIAVPAMEDKGLNSRTIEHFGRAKFFVFITLEDGKIESFYVKSNPFQKKKNRAGLMTAHEIVKEKTDVLLTRHIGEISFHTLRDHLIEVHLTKAKTVKEALQEFIEGKTERLEKPTRELGTELIRKN